MVRVTQSVGRRMAASTLSKIRDFVVSPTAIDKFVEKMTYKHFDRICNTVKRHITKGPVRVLSVDATRLSVSNKIRKEHPSFKTTKSGSYTQLLLTALFDVNAKIPLHFDISDNIGDERRGFKALIGCLKRGDILIFDRGYFSDQLIKLLEKKGVKFVFRMKRSSNLIRAHPGDDIKFTYSKSTMRAIQYKIGNNYYSLLTNLGYNYKWADFQPLYHSRWTIEVWFRYLKVDLNGHFYQFAKLSSLVKELYWQMLTSQLLGYVKITAGGLISKDRKDRYVIGFKALLHHAVDLLSHFTFYKRSSEMALNHLFNCYSITCLYPVVRLRSYPRYAIIDKGKWYRKPVKTNSEK